MQLLFYRESTDKCHRTAYVGLDQRVFIPRWTCVFFPDFLKLITKRDPILIKRTPLKIISIKDRGFILVLFDTVFVDNLMLNNYIHNLN